MMSSTIAQAVNDDLQAHDLVQISHRRVASGASGVSSELVGPLDEFEDQSPDNKLQNTLHEEDDADDAATTASFDSLPDGVIEIAELTDDALASLKGGNVTI